MNSYSSQEKKRPLPPWVFEYGPYMLIVAVVLLYVLPFKVLGWFDTPPEEVPVPHAELVVVIGPIKTWVEGSTTRVKSVEVKIQNRGEVQADGVAVYGIVRGNAFPLSGKGTLLVGETQGYSGDATVNVHSSDPIEFKLECTTCAAFAISSQ